MIKIDEPVDRFNLLFDSEEIRDSTESKYHYHRKKEIARKLLEKGWKVGVEESIDNPNSWNGYVVDVIAYKDDTWIAFEVGGTHQDKLDNLRDVFDAVRHTHYIDSKGKRYKELTGISSPTTNIKKPTSNKGKDDKDVYRRKIWETTNGSHLMTVTNILDVGRYDIDYEKKDNGTIKLYCEKLENKD